MPESSPHPLPNTAASGKERKKKKRERERGVKIFPTQGANPFHPLPFTSLPLTSPARARMARGRGRKKEKEGKRKRGEKNPEPRRTISKSPHSLQPPPLTESRGKERENKKERGRGQKQSHRGTKIRIFPSLFPRLLRGHRPRGAVSSGVGKWKGWEGGKKGG